MCNNETATQCKLLVQTIQDEIYRLQDVMFQVQCLEANASGFVALAAVAMQNSVQSLSAAADHLQHAANGTESP